MTAGEWYINVPPKPTQAADPRPGDATQGLTRLTKLRHTAAAQGAWTPPRGLRRERSRGRARSSVLVPTRTMADFVQRGGLAGSRIEDDLEFHWQLVDGLGTLADVRSQAVAYFAPEEPGLTPVRVTVRQRDLICVNEALITVTNELLAQINAATAPARGLPGDTFERAPGKSWRSKFDTRRNLIVVNNGHRDFVYASRAKS